MLTIAQTPTTVKGVVTSAEDNKPIAGVTVKIKGGTTSALTDQQGAFTIKADGTNTVLVFSHAGFTTLEEAVKGRTELSIQLAIDIKEIEDVVVIGYTTVKRKDLTGAVSSVGAKQLRDVPVNSVAEALTGRLAGVRITSAEGQPGSDFSIRIRGGGSITQDNSPLYIIDGVQVEDGFAGLSPQDIESVDVLKDVASTAIYGARGANGVVIITTKSGKEGKTKLTYNGMAGIRQLPRSLKLLSPSDFISYQFERSRFTNEETNAFTTLYGDDLERYKTIPAVDWQDKIFGRNALMQTHNVGLSGGNKTTQFNLSFTHNEEDGIMINSGLKRTLFNFKLDHKANNKLRVGLNFRYSRENITGAGSSDEGGSTYNGLRHTVKYRPFMLEEGNVEVVDDEDYYDATNTGNGLGIINPILLNNAQWRERRTEVVNIGGYLNYAISKQFSFRSTVGVDRNTQDRRSFDGSITSNARLNGASLPLISMIELPRTSFNNSNVLTFKHTAGNSRLSVMAGQELYTTNTHREESRLRYFPESVTPEKAFGQLSLGSTVPLYPQSRITESALLSFFSRADYDFDGKYIASVSIRADGSSKFAEDQRWGYFPSASLAWRISKESFMDKMTWLSDLKLRASYGQAGNNRIDDYLYLNTYSATVQYPLNEGLNPGYVANSLANSRLKWETTVSRNIGLDVALFNNRIQLTADAYKNTVHDLLIPIRIPVSSGQIEQLQNVGTTSNTGIELNLSAAIVQAKSFSWNSNFNIAFNRNKVEKLTGYLDYFYASSGFGISGQPADFIVKTGSPVGSMYGYVNDGFYTVNDFDYDVATTTYTLKKGVTDVGGAIGIAQPGWMKLKDLDGNGIIDESDKTIIGNATPKFEGGWLNQFNYKNFDLSIFVNFVYGNTIYNANKIEFTNAYSRHTNMLEIMKDRWRTVDDAGDIVQRVTTVGGKQVVTGVAPDLLAELNKNAQIWQPIAGAGAFYPTSWVMEDGSFLRLNNITLGYAFPQSLLKKAKMGNLRAYVTVNNIAVLTGYSGYDPEVNARRQTPLTPGVDYSAYPRSRAFFFGLNLSL
ncbi:SusC/RagA family TonB-linked outer membrane protein [Paraflavitalea pollutisoli]|uniref:SusC/RagA family TonB-linked outer membrane protein n=1 Tax=Paraflavitalea pollutisoli TaxID=3034143 RepID=UPI0023EBE373|nr:TonB-dependent receptor [Paraflavitalea sp. H1-2-19X]